MIKMVSAQEGKAKSLLLDLCIRNRLAANTRAESYAESSASHFRGKSLLSDRCHAVVIKAASTIMNTITRRTFDFSEVDKALVTLKDYGIQFGDNPKSTECTWQIRKLDGAAKFLAWCCMKNEIYWNDTAYTTAERDDFVSKSSFAYWLFEGECFVSQISTKKPAARAKVASTDPTAGTTVGSRSGGAPKSGYKSAGPQSAFVAGLVSKPGEKEHVSSSYVYGLVGDKAGTITPKAFIHPVENPAIGETATLGKSGLPLVKFGAGNGYTDLAIFTTSSEAMEKIREQLVTRGTCAKYSGVRVVSVKNDGKGFFKVNTELGEVLVRTTKLNEKLFEEAMAAEAVDKSEDTPAILHMEQFVRDSKMYD